MALPNPFIEDQNVRRNFEELDQRLALLEIVTDITVASATTVTLKDVGTLFSITGTTDITSVTASGPGRIVVLKFADILTITDGSNLKIAGAFVTTADDTITLICDGTNWYEMARSRN